MVLLAAAVCTKAGKAIVSRQFVEMSKSRIEGLLAAFPKLMSSGKQHTFVETESVRYVYQPLDKLYMLLITTKASNILEDLETLRLFSRVIPEYCKSMDESEIFNNVFNLIFAFDEIVALGYRESINLSQIRAFTSMESHEEKVYQAVRQTQEREAKLILKEKAKELQRLKVESSKKGNKPTFAGSGFGSSSFSPNIMNDNMAPEVTKPAYSQISKPIGPSKAMKLGGKDKDVDLFVDQLKSEGVNVSNISQTTKKSNTLLTQSSIPTEPVHFKIEENIIVTAGRDGDLQSMELHGLVKLNIKEEEFGRIFVQMNDITALEAQFQSHPNIDKDLFKKKFQIAMKNHQKPFPIDTDVGVLKWRFQSTEENHLPLSINFWASHKSDGGSDVNIEYELQHTDKELHDVLVTIPMNHPSPNYVVSECQGEYTYDKAKRSLLWSIPIIDVGAPSGSMEFTCKVDPEQLYPVQVHFVSKQKYFNLEVIEVRSMDDNSLVKYSTENILMTEKYELN